MTLLIPEKIYFKLNNINKVFLEGFNEEDFAFSLPVFLEHIKAIDRISIASFHYNKCTRLSYRVIYKDGTIETFVYKNKEDLLIKQINLKRHIRKNVSDLFPDTLEGMNDCLDQINSKIIDTKTLCKTTIGTKNLIYYTVFLNDSYIELLKLSIDSILCFTDSINLDFLIITDKETKTKIDQKVFFKPINLHFLILDTPSDGIEASKCKTKLYDWEFIHQYQNILFLDTDVVAVDEIKYVFDICQKNNTIYTAYAQNPDTIDFRNYYHGFEMLSEEFVQEMKQTKQQPFNAGQFLFKNSKIMKAHFENINWFMKNWPGVYFFEQSFMCYYFAKARCVEDGLMSTVDFCSLENTRTTKQIKPSTVLLHFAGEALDGEAKLKFIEENLAPIIALKTTKNGVENNFLA